MALTFGIKRILTPGSMQSLLHRIRLKRTTNFTCMCSTLSSNTAYVDKFVYHSISNNIFENLALEEWIYENIDFSHRDVLLMWQSNPCVVIGKHQNPWIEANVSALPRKNVQLARRSSGGGTVYHDKGNLNLSFLKDRSRYNRRENLELVIRALKSQWDLDLVVNERDDIILDSLHKISGTAAKLTRNKSYHHFTLLHSVDRSKLTSCLASPLNEDGNTQTEQTQGMSVQSRSTRSVPAPVHNLQSVASDMTMELLMGAIDDEFLTGTAQNQRPVSVNPMDEHLFPGVKEICQRLQSWEWVFGKTPKFCMKVEFPDNDDNDDNDSSSCDGGIGRYKEYKGVLHSVDIGVEKGCLVNFHINLNNEEKSSLDLAELLDFRGIKMARGDLSSVLDRSIRRQDLLGVESCEKLSNALPSVDAAHVLEAVRNGVLEKLIKSLL